MASRTQSSEAGFTLASLVIIMTVIMIMIAYTIPGQWSRAMARERDQQTFFAMKQYARAMRAFQDKNKTPPVSLDQLKQARSPRFIRGTKGEFVDPLTGEVDWIIVPYAAQTTGVVPPPSGGLRPPGGFTPPPVAPQPGLPGQSTPKPGQPGGFVGPMMGVRPNKTGQSYLSVNGQDTYEQWSYTTNDLNIEIQQRQQGLAMK